MSLLFENKKLLFISPHTDDVELAAGGTLVKALREGAEVYYLALTTTDNKIQLRKEATQSMKSYGIPKENYVFEEFKDTYFPSQRNDILDLLEAFRDKWEPNIVFCPSRNDSHQDHETTTLETLRVFKWTAGIILGYDISWNMITEPFKPSFYVELSHADLIKKVEAVKCYKSQKHKVYVKEKTLEGRAINAGVKVGVEFAEAFEIYRMVNKL